MNKYTVIDIETTGLKYLEGAEITEIAGCNVVDGEIITTFSSLIKTKGKLSDFIVNLTGITNQMIVNAPAFDFAMTYFFRSLNIVPDTNIIIHNVEFDYNFIKYWLNKNNIINPLKDCNKICSLELARKVLPGEIHKLEVLKKKFGIRTKSHRALNDVLVTKKVYEELKKIENG